MCRGNWRPNTKQDTLIQETLKQQEPEAPPMSDAQHSEALELLRDPKLLDRILADCETCGLVGEATNKLVCYLACVSRHLPAPLAVLIQSSSGAGKTTLQDAVVRFMPEEEQVRFSAMTGQSLYYMGRTALKHKILAVAEKEGVMQARYALKLLQSDGKLRIAIAERDRDTGRLPTRHNEVEAVLAQADVTTLVGLQDRAIMETLYSTGLRRAEALNLHLSDLDRHRRVVLVRLGKGNKDRFAPIGERALAWIDKYLNEVRPKLLQDPVQPLLFITGKGRPIHPNGLSARVRGYMNGAGVTKRGACHLFRHSAATLMLDRGADIRHIQAILGHESLCTTQIYTHVSIGKLCEVHARTHPGRRLRRSSAGSLDPRGRPRLSMAAARKIPERLLLLAKSVLRSIRRSKPAPQASVHNEVA